MFACYNSGKGLPLLSSGEEAKDAEKHCIGTSLVVQWLRLCAPNAGDSGSIPGQETRSQMLQLKIVCATTNTQCSQMNKNKNKKPTVQWIG